MCNLEIGCRTVPCWAPLILFIWKRHKDPAVRMAAGLPAKMSVILPTRDTESDNLRDADTRGLISASRSTVTITWDRREEEAIPTCVCSGSMKAPAQHIIWSGFGLWTASSSLLISSRTNFLDRRRSQVQCIKHFLISSLQCNYSSTWRRLG